MWGNLRNRFIHVTLGSIIWVMFITSASNIHTEVSYLYMWRIVLIGGLFGLVFGIIYYYLWNYSNLNANYKVLLSSIANFICIIISVYLYSSVLFTALKPYMVYMFCLTFILHFAIFKVYLRIQNKKLVEELKHLN